MWIYTAHRCKNASNALDVPSTDQKDTFSVYDENSQFACLAHAHSIYLKGTLVHIKLKFPIHKNQKLKLQVRQQDAYPTNAGCS